MGIMKILGDLEDELYETGQLIINKNIWYATTALRWFCNNKNSEDYDGIFKNINLNITENDKSIIIEFDRTVDNLHIIDKNIYEISMQGLKDTLNDIVNILKEEDE